MMREDVHFFTVSELNEAVQSVLDSEPAFFSACVEGELSNYKVYPSGHHYFTLKDSMSSLRCVMFRSNASRLRFQPENGMQVHAVGRVQVYLRDGCYQLYCSDLIPNGIGDLQLAFEQLKKKLFQEGLFELSHKKKLPVFPERVVLVTSEAGAAVHDMLRILRTRWPMTTVMIYPVRVQGKEAPGEIAEAIRKVNDWQIADCMIVGRGGGSLEDLWAFNEECVARAIYASSIPVISAVGHEPDVTIADFVSDKRASTPSNAAEIAVPDQKEISEMLNALKIRLFQAAVRALQHKRQELDRYSRGKALADASYFLDIRRMEADRLSDQLYAGIQSLLTEKRSGLISSAASLNAMSPMKVLSRGYLIAEDADHRVLRSIRQISTGMNLNLQFADGLASCIVKDREVTNFDE